MLFLFFLSDCFNWCGLPGAVGAHVDTHEQYQQWQEGRKSFTEVSRDQITRTDVAPLARRWREIVT